MNIDQQLDLLDTIELMEHSKYHKRWYIEDISRLIRTPILLNQYKLYRKEEKPVCFTSWATLTPDTAHSFNTRTHKLQPEDWNAGKQLWFIDFIAPYGNVIKYVRDLHKVHPNSVGHLSRTYGTDHVQRIGSYKNV
tara:strand:- start:2567 stop:2974 length:408 start_codon:yes stop_codon:yes gene_type:complete